MVKIISRIFGGIGNQLFCYAAARRLALVNGAELVIDEVSGFAYDKVYKQHYQLDHFSIPCRKATAAERLEPFDRYWEMMLLLLFACAWVGYTSCTRRQVSRFTYLWFGILTAGAVFYCTYKLL